MGNERLSLEKKTVGAMVRIYCRGSGHACLEGKDLCGACEGLLNYSLERLQRCLFGEKKPACIRCSVHCYHPARRSEIASVMRYSGPKMVFRHPYLAARHFMAAGKSEGF